MGRDMSASAQKISQEKTSTQVSLKVMANAIRALAMDAVQKANSGHPGMPMGMADVATVLYSKFLKFNPKKPHWEDRDRFILSGGHGSMLLYALNYLTGYEEMTIDEIKNFRQLHSKTPGHPEIDVDCGIEMTTGPLGQGISTAPGFALAERMLNVRFGDDLVDHYTYVMCGDGDLQEGISHESCAFAGHQKLSKLIVLYDANDITIDGPTDISFTEDVCKRFEAYGWDTQEIDGHDMDAIEKAISHAKTTGTPSLISCKTKIGFGAPTKEGTAACHGAPLGDDEIKGVRENLNWAHAPFEIPEDVLSAWRSISDRNTPEYEAWVSRSIDAVEFKHEQAGLDQAVLEGKIQEAKSFFGSEKPKMATRQTSGKVLEYLIPCFPNMIGGSADLTGSNNTIVKGYEEGPQAANGYKGQYIYYGVREHGMAAMMNGMSLHGGITPYSGTFLQFADYSRPAIRLGALMGTQVIHVMTHDSIGLGEDGPTHQPVEHMSALRAIPNCYVYRPCDGVETAECWELALKSTNAPSVMALTRQGLPTLAKATDSNVSSKGAYILEESSNEPQVTLFASGSEVSIAKEAYDTLTSEGIEVRLVSAPCLDLFWEQDSAYIESLLCNSSIKIAVEAAIRQSWDRIIGHHGAFIGMTGFGDSAPASDLYKHFGITAEAIVDAAKAKLK